MQFTLMQYNRKKIAAIIWKDGTGGAERSLSDLASALDRDKFEMRFYYLSGEPGNFAQYIQRLGFTTIFLNWKNGYDLRGRIRLIKSLSSYSPHLIHDHILPPLTRPLTKLFIHKPILYTEHGVACHRKLSGNSFGLRKTLEKFDLQFCDLIAANSKSSAAALQSVYNISPKKIKTVHLGINVNNFQPTQQSRSQLHIGYLGRILNSHKGVDRLPLVANFLLKSKKQHDFQFLIAGDGPDRSAVEELCVAQGVQNQFKFLGWISDVQSFFSQIDVLVIPSRSESLGLIALESLAMNIPVVAFNIGGLPEILTKCPIGYLVEQGDIEGMANAILRATKESIQSKLTGREYIEKNFSSHSMTRKIEKIYMQMIGHKSSWRT